MRTDDFSALSAYYTEENKVAEIISPPLRDELLPMMKLSSNLHTVAWPYLVGAIARNASENAKAKGLEIQMEMYRQIGVDANVPLNDLQEAELLQVVSEARYSPKAYTSYLAYLNDLPYFDDYLSILPILGVDGTIADMDPTSAAAGHTFAKSGSAMGRKEMDGSMQAFIVKALAGYIELPNGRMASFSMFTEYATQKPDMSLSEKAFGDIINAVYKYLATEG